MQILIGFYGDLKNGKTTEAEFRIIKNTALKSSEILMSCFKLAFKGKVTFPPTNMLCSVVFIYD